MKATGIVRRVDDLGRIVIPKEIRRKLGIKDGEPMEIFLDGKTVCFQKYSNEDDIAEKCRKIVEKYHNSISSVVSKNDRTIVVLNNGSVGSSVKAPSDQFDLNVAIVYALIDCNFINKSILDEDIEDI